ncbi:CLUMA_CG020029, isoform A [Clunio marinus]|uniref:CLUMA_CG020029, isoform A n=1 Tax=Clunio marinus TaxID=568069 RepID=A0A1J1J3D8_9DIPT|nr:CLUMA_CG020030, isoform A [Clunio marinus]CRL06972.1 CLUMA_CG020029, isoform A [Clunio marinus]
MNSHDEGQRAHHIRFSIISVSHFAIPIKSPTCMDVRNRNESIVIDYWQGKIKHKSGLAPAYHVIAFQASKIQVVVGKNGQNTAIFGEFRSVGVQMDKVFVLRSIAALLKK